MIRKYHNHKPQTIPYTARKNRSTLIPQPSFLHLFLPKPCHKRCFSRFYPYSNQSLTKKGIFSMFHGCPYSNQSPATKGVFFSIFPFWVFSLFCSNLNNYPVRKGVFNYFSLILTKALPKRVFSLFFFSILP